MHQTAVSAADKKRSYCIYCKHIFSYYEKKLVCDVCHYRLTFESKKETDTEEESLHMTLISYFKSFLSEIDKSSSSLMRNVDHSEDRLKSYFDKIRSDIDLSVEKEIKRLTESKSALLNNVDCYQKETIDNLSVCETYRRELNSYLDTIRKYCEAWDVDLSKNGNETILHQTRAAYSYKIELERRKIEFERFIFNKKLILFKEDVADENKIGYLSIVEDSLPVFEHWIKVDLNKTLYLSALDPIEQPIYIEEFDSNKLLCCFISKIADQFGMSKLKLIIMNENGIYLRSIKEKTYLNEFKIYKFKNQILFGLYSNYGNSHFKIYNEDLKCVAFLESLNFTECPIASLCANERLIYFCYQISDQSTEIYALNWHLKHANAEGSIKGMEYPFKFNRRVDQIECFESKMYLKHSNMITIINEENGDFLRVLELPCNCRFSINLAGFFVMFCNSENKIMYLNSNCDMLNENKIDGFPMDLTFYYNKYQKSFFFFGKNNYILYKFKNKQNVFKTSFDWYSLIKKIY